MLLPGDVKCRGSEADRWRWAEHLLYVGVLRVWNAVDCHTERSTV